MNESEIRHTITEIESELASNEPTADLYNDAGVGYYLLGEYEVSLQYLKRAVEMDDQPSILFNLANTHSDLGNPEMAIDLYLKTLEKDPGHVGALNNLADEYEKTGNEQKADELFRYITKLQPDEALPFFNLGNFYLRQNKHIRAAKCYETALEKNSKFSDAYYNIAWILYRAKAYRNSLDYLEKGLNISPEHREMNNLKSEIQSLQDDTAV